MGGVGESVIEKVKATSGLFIVFQKKWYFLRTNHID